MTYEMIRALLVFWLDIGTIGCIFIGKPRYHKIPFAYKEDYDLLKDDERQVKMETKKDT